MQPFATGTTGAVVVDPSACAHRKLIVATAHAAHTQPARVHPQTPSMTRDRDT